MCVDALNCNGYCSECVDDKSKIIKDQTKRIADLEEYLRSWVETADQFATRAVAAEAKLARVGKEITAYSENRGRRHRIIIAIERILKYESEGE